MCLSVAVLCMGVLAYNSATYKITGSMTYNMTADLAKINTRVYRVAEKLTESELKTAIDGTTSATGLVGKTYAQIESDTSYVVHQKLTTLNAISSSSTEETYSSDSISMTFGELDKEDECYYTYYIVISVVNKSTDGTLTATLSTTIETDSTFYRYTNTTQTSISNTDTKNIVIGISKIDDTTITQSDFTYEIIVSYVEKEDWPIELKTDTENSCWYVELGTYNNSPVKWRLVSTNGTSACTFDSSTKPKYTDLKGKAVFVNYDCDIECVFSEQSSSYIASNAVNVSKDNNHNILKSCIISGDFDRTLYAADITGGTDYNNNYYESYLRSQLMNGKIFGFNDVSEFSNIVQGRDIKSITGTSSGSFVKKDSYLDYFWELSYGEYNSFPVLNDGRLLWTRTPVNETSLVIMMMDTYGAHYPSSTSGYVMAGFILK